MVAGDRLYRSPAMAKAIGTAVMTVRHALAIHLWLRDWSGCFHFVRERGDRRQNGVLLHHWLTITLTPVRHLCLKNALIELALALWFSSKATARTACLASV